MKKALKKFDEFLIELINIKMSHRYLDALMYRVTNLGGAVFSTLLVISLILIGSTNTKIVGIESLVSLCISQAVVHTLKKILGRERPYNIIEHLNTFGINLKDYSFPSGHTAASFSIATTIALNMPKLTILVFTIAIIVGISRIYLAVHYPTDVAAGIIIGTILAIIVHYQLMEFVYKLGEFIGIEL